MSWERTEDQVLLASWDRIHRGAAPPRSPAALQKRVDSLFDDEARPIDATLPTLVEQGLLRREEGGYLLTETGTQHAARLSAQMFREGFEAKLVRYFESQAHAELSRRVYGTAQHQLNMVDQVQWDRLISLLALEPTDHLVDLGCATGAISEAIFDAFGCQVTGIDLARSAIDRARERTRAKAPRLRFSVGDLNALELPAQGFDVALSVDTLYFVNDISQVIGRILGLLRPGGRLLVFWSQNLSESSDPTCLEPGKTAVAQALSGHGVPWQSWEFTDETARLWQRTMTALDALETTFAAEGSTDLWQDRRQETTTMVERYQDQRTRRYLYLATISD